LFDVVDNRLAADQPQIDSNAAALWFRGIILHNCFRRDDVEMRLMKLTQHLAKHIIKLSIGCCCRGARGVLLAHLVPIKASERRIEMLVLNGAPDYIETLFPRA